MIFVEFHSNESVRVILAGNVPMGQDLKRFLARNNLEVKNRRLSIDIARGSQHILSDIADADRRQLH